MSPPRTPNREIDFGFGSCRACGRGEAKLRGRVSAAISSVARAGWENLWGSVPFRAVPWRGRCPSYARPLPGITRGTFF